ncbi:MAG: hypothetical protein KC468_13045 [Myxococcales bacterium]|nr:hypothetical protein [Myxococcales bacterium]
MTDWRTQWLALLAEPRRDDIARELVRSVQLDQELAAGQPHATAIGRLLRDLFILHHITRDRVPFEPGPYWRAILSNFGATAPADIDDEDEDEDDVDVDVDDAEDADSLDPNQPFYAWDLSQRAVEAPLYGRAGLVDQALDAFERIVNAPRDPGNDNGPMCDLAKVMTTAQVRRAWTIERRMAAAGWLSPNWTAPCLVTRLAAIGEWSEAQALLPQIADREGRALALGRMAAHAALAARPFALVAPAQRRWLEGDGLVELVRGLTLELRWPERAPPASLIVACLELVRQHPDPRARSGALVLLEGWYGAGPTELWRRAIEAYAVGEAQVHALFSLAEGAADARDIAEIVRAAVRRLFELPRPRATRWLGSYAATLKALPHHEAWEVLARMLVSAGHDGSWPLADLSGPELVDLLRWLGGDEVLASVAEHLRDVERCLGR